MPKEIRNRRLIRFSGSLLLLSVTFVLLWPAFRASAERPNPQDQKPSQQQGVTAPMQPIRPVSVAVVNFEKLARAEQKLAAAPGVKKKPEFVEIHPPLTVPEPEEPVSNAPTVEQSPQPQLQ